MTRSTATNAAYIIHDANYVIEVRTPRYSESTTTSRNGFDTRRSRYDWDNRSTFDDGRRLTGETLGNGVTETRTYSTDNLLTGISYGGTGTSIGNLSYTWDANKNKTSDGFGGTMSGYGFTYVCSILLQAVFFFAPSEIDALLSVRKHCEELELLYLSKTLTESEIYSSHQSIEIRIFEELRKAPPEDTVKFIDFDKPLEAYFILGSIFSTETRGAKPFFQPRKRQVLHLSVQPLLG